jgi:hypothetical protein
MAYDTDDLALRISSLEYSERESDLLRYVDCNKDEELRTYVTRLTELSSDERSRVVEPESLVNETLTMYSGRRTLLALRTGSLASALEAFEARLVLSKVLFESWRRGALYSAYVATTLGALPDTLASLTAKLGDDELNEVVADIIDNLSRISSLRDVGRIEIRSHYGLGVLGVKQVRPDRSPSGPFMYPAAPVLVRSADQRFDADTSLALVTIAVADSIDQLSGTSVGLIQISEFPGEALIEMGLREHVGASACLSMTVLDNASGRETFQCSVADMEHSAAVDTVLDVVTNGAGSDSYICASGVGHYLVLLFEQPDFGDGAQFDDAEELVETNEFNDSAGPQLANGAALVERIELALSALAPETVADRDSELT